MTAPALRALRAATHHITGHLVGGEWSPAKPLKYRGWLGWWWQWRSERQCARTIGHCWHLEHGHWIDWYCCACGGEVDGQPPSACVACADLAVILSEPPERYAHPHGC